MQELFLELLQVSLGVRDSLTRVPSSIEWQAIYIEGQHQAVDIVLLSGIDRLPEEQRPSKAFLLQWIGAGEMLRHQNVLLNKRCADLQAVLSHYGLRCCILKGQGNAILYPTPLSRRCGDIDIWVDGERGTILDIIRTIGRVEHVDIKHCAWGIYQDILVEIHFYPTWFYNPIINHKLHKWVEKNKREQFENKTELCFNVPTITFNLVYILIHIYRHLFDEGVGLRHLMDYYFFLKYSSVEERQEAMRVLDSFKMKRFVGAIMDILLQNFKMDDGYLLCQPIKKEGRFLFGEMMRAGNLGQFDERKKLCHGRWANGIENVKRNTRFLCRYPQEVCWMPVWKFWHYCWRKRLGYL